MRATSRPERITDAARELGISPSQLRRDIAAGAPVQRPGGRGRGRGALVVVADVKAWRERSAPAFYIAGLERALRDVLTRDGGLGEPAHVSLGIPRARAATLLLAAYERAYRKFTDRDAPTLPAELEQYAHDMRVSGQWRA